MPERIGPRRGHRYMTALAVVAALTAMTAPPSAALARTAQSPSVSTEFTSSFEADESQPDWRNTTEVGPGGEKRASGVEGGASGGIPGNITERVVELRASGENAGAGEIKENLIDIQPATKWLAFQPAAWVEFDLDAPAEVTTYALTSANDFPERDPRDWTLQGSTDGKEWRDLDTRKGETFGQRFLTRSFDVAAARVAPYRHYRLDITANNGASGATQLADVQFSDGSTGTPAPRDMRTLTDRGPGSSPTAKAGMGFTGKRALMYAGSHGPAGRAYAYNKIFEVTLPVRRDTALSYRIFPSLPAAPTPDLSYAATNVAVDLAFTDGTYLSELGATDAHGGALTPQGQGDAKRLYVNQWNQVDARIGAVAAGKTVARILVGYDSRRGPASFQGWIDDISLRPQPAEKPLARVSDYVSTTRGTNSSGSFSRGNNFPATAVPHGFNFWTPLTNAGSTSWLYEYSRANNADNLPTLQAFGASHEPSPWMGDRGTFQLMPSTAAGPPDASRTARALPFRHENETAKPHYYGVTFENGLRTELAPTDHAAMVRITYPDDNANLILDNVSNAGGLTLDPATRSFSGFSDVKSGLSAGATRLFVYGVVDAPVTASGRLTGGGGSNVTGYLRLDAGADRTVTVRLATSLISLEQAERNLAAEAPAGIRFEQVRDRAQRAWDDILGRVRVEGADRDRLTTLYSNLYRLYLYPNSGSENTGTAADPKYQYASPFSPATGQDTPTRTGAKIVDGEVYVNNGFWDTYRTTWPAYSLLTPKKAGKLVDGFVQQYKDGGWTARWSSPGYADLMTGTSADVAFADAYLKGVGFDAKAAYEAGVKNATVVAPRSGVGRKGMETSTFTGYASTSTHEGLSWSLEGYLNDYGLARMGAALAKKTTDKRQKARYEEESAYFRNRAQYYVSLFDEKAGFFQGRDTKGDWRVPSEKFDPRVWGYDFTETNGWNYAFTAVADTRGLANLYGGRAGLAQKLDTFFSTPETATAEFKGSYGSVIHEMTEARDVRMGMYGHSNQPSHHIPYLYDAAGQPWKTQEKVREVLSRLYTGSEIGQGYPGDEDNGEMSGWYIFSALGFYPLVMGGGEYAIGSPLFTKATVRMDNGRTLVVKAPKNSDRNIYVQGLKVNGKPWHSTALPHDLVARGGTLEFAMGPRPSSWGTGANAAPTSLTRDDKVPSPRTDALRGPGALFDDSAATSATVESVELPVASPVRAVQYTLTSATATAAPTGWRLEGSADGTAWRVLDTRAGESFSWDRQTRVFTVRDPGTYARYRLVSDAPATLAEVELLR
ncbi:GH92 family glycosyl hydrolase [Streptomyces paludis]|uniref:Glycoside hydrolase family 92 protein n=1 Tax=Streptomyces paludis TaxID=2282738 RepID=A0A345HW52_9ACTN|nr:glycoside hydrolase family 92 protein [Streptomyces paludis]